jgi:uncharacterized protein (TIGR02246 family)
MKRKPNMPSKVFLRTLCIITIVVTASCSNPSTNDEATISAQNQKWMELIVKKDAAAVAQLYAEDGTMLPPNAPKVVGRAALQTAWGELFKIPGMTLTFKTERFIFSNDRTMATEIGSYAFGMGDGENRTVDLGKAVVVWVKQGNTWLVQTDMFSSDAPPAPPQQVAAPVPAPTTTTMQPPAPETALAIAASDATLQWGACPPIFPAPCQIAVLHGDPAASNADVFLKVPGKYEIPAHWHTSAERMTLVTGEMMVTYQGQPASTLRVGNYAYGPAKLPHKATCISDDPCTLFIAFEAPVDAVPFDGTIP